MAKRKSLVHFERPRDEDGHFLPQELWTKKELRDFDRLKKNGLLKNPITKTKMKGQKAKGLVWSPPKDENGKYIREEDWTPAEKREFELAKQRGWITAAQMRRDDKGRFISPTGKKPKKRKTALSSVEHKPYTHPEDAFRVQQVGGGVTVVYPPYPPQPVYPPPAPPQVQQIPVFADLHHPLSQRGVLRDLRSLEEIEEPRNHQLDLFSSGGVLYERDPETGSITQCIGIEQLRDDVRREADLTRKEFEKSCGPCFIGKIDHLRQKNPRRLHPMYYVKRTFGENISRTVGAMKDNPLLALVAVGALFVVGYALYRVFKAVRIRMLGSLGVEIVNGTIYFPGSQPYVITESDKLWLARSIWGEVSRTPSDWSLPTVRQGGSAVLWSYANHYITVGNKRGVYSSLGDFIQGYSQPVNPAWIDPNGPRCQQSPAMCTSERIAFRRALRAKPWSEFPADLQNLVLAFTAGQIQNPIGTRTDFRASGTGYVPTDALVVAGNVFGTAANARRRPVEQVA